MPATSLMERHSNMVGKSVDANSDLHLCDRDNLAALSVLNQEEFVAARLIAEPLTQLLQ